MGVVWVVGGLMIALGPSAVVLWRQVYPNNGPVQVTRVAINWLIRDWRPLRTLGVLMCLAVAGWQFYLESEPRLDPQVNDTVRGAERAVDAWLAARLEPAARLTIIAVALTTAGLLAWRSGPIWRWVVRQVRQVFALDVDDQVAFGDKDGYGPFTALATFALAQGAALTVVARGEERVWLVLAIYAVAVAFTVRWIQAQLAAVKSQPPAAGSAAPLAAIVPPAKGPPAPAGAWTTRRAYDRPTITYGRWTQGWTLVLAVVLIYLGTQGLLPNQTRRTAFLKDDIPVDFNSVQNRRQGALAPRGDQAAREQFDVWVRWLAEGDELYARARKAEPAAPVEQKVAGKQNQPPQPDRRLIWVEQRADFQQFYKSFTARLTYATDKIELRERVAFLVRRDAGSPRPIYRQVQFRPNRDGGASDIFEVTEPNPDEILVILVYVRSKEKLFTLDRVREFDIKVVRYKTADDPSAP